MNHIAHGMSLYKMFFIFRLVILLIKFLWTRGVYVTQYLRNILDGTKVTGFVNIIARFQFMKCNTINYISFATNTIIIIIIIIIIISQCIYKGQVVYTYLCSCYLVYFRLLYYIYTQSTCDKDNVCMRLLLSAHIQQIEIQQ